MKAIILKQHEVVHLRDTGSVIAWRVVSCQPHTDCGVIRCRTFNPAIIGRNGEWKPGPDTFVAYSEDGEWVCKCPYGRTGGERWVKETWAADKYYDGRPGNGCGPIPEGVAIECKACPDGVTVLPGRAHRSIQSRGKWRSSTNMPRWAFRFTVTLDVGVKRIQEVTEGEAKMSGVGHLLPVDVSRMTYPTKEIQGQLAASIDSNTKGSWDRNDYFWKITCTLKK